MTLQLLVCAAMSEVCLRRRQFSKSAVLSLRNAARRRYWARRKQNGVSRVMPTLNWIGKDAVVSANGGNVLTRAVLASLPLFDGPKVIYCAGCLIGPDRLKAENILVRQTPYEIKVS